jgi:LmbE family N-acetylglucosaminyl deacetylase
MTQVKTAMLPESALVRPERHLFVSPHYDDIALSAGGTAARVGRLGRTPEVAIVFGAEPPSDHVFTPFATAMHEGWGMSAGEVGEVIAGRRAEEAAAAAVLGTVPSFLPFHDAIYRGERYLGDPDLFGEVRADESGLASEIIAALDLDETAKGSTRVYVPLAIGWHVDHQVAFQAGVELDGAGWDVWFYEDLPYALKPGILEDRIARAGKAVDVAALVPVEETWNAKIDAIMAYPSQLATIFNYVEAGSSRGEIESLLRRYAEEAGDGVAVERFWRVATTDEP